MKTIFKEKKFIISFLILIISQIFLYCQMLLHQTNMTISYKLVFIVFSLIVNLGYILLYKNIKSNENIKIEIIFLKFTLFFGLIYLFIIPILLGTDEVPHFYRPYQISVGDVIVRNPNKNTTKIPESLSSLASRNMKDRYNINTMLKPVNYDKTEMLYNPMITSIQYSPIPYTPQIIGFWIAKILPISPLATVYLVRLINFISWVIMGYFSLKILPTKKIFAFVLYLSPAVLSIVSTSSGDVFSNGAMFLLISYILSLIKSRKKLSYKDYILLIMLSLIISTFKTVYFLILGLLYLIPKDCFKNNSIKRKLFIVSSIIFSMVMIDICWMTLSSQSSALSNELIKDQLKFIINNPLQYGIILLNTYITEIYYYFTNFVAGSEMIYGLARINELFVISYCVVLIITMFEKDKFIKLSKKQVALIWSVILMIFVLVNTIMYLDWTTSKLGVKSIIIAGVQSRYFINFLLPIVITINFNKIYTLKNKRKIYYLVLLLSSILVLDVLKSMLIIVFPS